MSADAFPSHAPGEPCPVIDLLYTHFGEEVGEYLLWEFTCFPMSDDHAYGQARELVAADRVGLLREFLRSVRHAQDAEGWLAAADYVEERVQARTCTRIVWRAAHSGERLLARPDLPY